MPILILAERHRNSACGFKKARLPAGVGFRSFRLPPPEEMIWPSFLRQSYQFWPQTGYLSAGFTPDASSPVHLLPALFLLRDSWPCLFGLALAHRCPLIGCSYVLWTMGLVCYCPGAVPKVAFFIPPDLLRTAAGLRTGGNHGMPSFRHPGKVHQQIPAD